LKRQRLQRLSDKNFQKSSDSSDFQESAEIRKFSVKKFQILKISRKIPSKTAKIQYFPVKYWEISNFSGYFLPGKTWP
jgi:hypothetical protein